MSERPAAAAAAGAAETARRSYCIPLRSSGAQSRGGMVKVAVRKALVRVPAEKSVPVNQTA